MPAMAIHAVTDPPTDDEQKPRLRVKDLAKRFEQINNTPNWQPSKPPKRVGKFRIVSGTAEPVRIGLARKKSSLKRRSISTHDIRQRGGSQRKSQSTVSSRAPSKESLNERVHKEKSAETTGEDERVRKEEREQTKENKLPSREMTVSPRGVKPPPPLKPARLRNATKQVTEEKPSSQVSPSSSTSTLPRDVNSKTRIAEKEIEYQEKATVSLTVRPVAAASRPSVAPPPAPPTKPPSRDRINRRSTVLAKAKLNRSNSSSTDSIYQVLDDSSEAMPTYLRVHEFVPRVPSSAPPPLPTDPSHRLLPLPPSLPPPSLGDRVRERRRVTDSDRPVCRPPSAPCAPTNREQSAQPRPESRETQDEEEDFYEEIGTNLQMKPRDYSSTSGSSSSDYVTSIYCGAETEKCSMSANCRCSNCGARRKYTAYSIEGELYGEPSPSSSSSSNFQKCSATLGRKTKRPTSTIEFDKLIKFKSDFHLNLSKKMERLRKRVTAEKNRRSVSRCTVDSEGLNTDGTMGHEDDRYIYGDDWSSDEEVEVREERANVPAVRRSSMYEEIEEKLNQVFPLSKMDSATDSPTSSSDYRSYSPTVYEASPPPPDNDVTVDLDAIQLRSPLDTPIPISTQDETTPRVYTSRLPDTQPLYQLYMLAEQEKLLDEVALRDIREDKEMVEASTSIQNKPCRRQSSASSDSGRGADCSTSASALTSSTSLRRERLIATSHFGSQRSLWCELPEVKSAGLLETLDEDVKQLQEAYFEVITSEASYLRSLNILITHFMADPTLLGAKNQSSIISNEDRKHLFSNIFAVRDCSERLLCDLESRLEECLVLDDICEILVNHFESNFDAYVKYCSNQVYQDRTLRRLKTESVLFMSAVARLESDRQCQGLDMRSFLMLPMQRITRYPLLIYAILERLPPSTSKHRVAARVLLLANQVVSNCNEGARRMERTEQLLDVDRRLLYKDSDLKRLALVSAHRHLVKRGLLIELCERKSKGLLQSRQKARPVYVFLFSDILLVTKRKMNGTYICQDYADRRYVDTAPLEPENTKIPLGALQQLANKPHLFLCVLMKNARGRQSELLLSAESESDRERWLSAIRPPASVNPEEKVYADWDCPQAIVMHAYEKGQEDELDLTIGETVNILRKMPDGWFYGERVRDSIGGWFPSSYIQQIVNDHTRAKNYRQRLRLIQAATDLRSHQMAAARSGATIRTPAIINRLRRMSNPKNLFQAV